MFACSYATEVSKLRQHIGSGRKEKTGRVRKRKRKELELHAHTKEGM